MKKKDKEYALYLGYIVFILNNTMSKMIELISRNSKSNEDIKKLWDEIFRIIPCNIDSSKILIEAMKKFNKKLINKNVSINKNFEILENYLKKSFFTN